MASIVFYCYVNIITLQDQHSILSKGVRSPLVYSMIHISLCWSQHFSASYWLRCDTSLIAAYLQVLSFRHTPSAGERFHIRLSRCKLKSSTNIHCNIMKGQKRRKDSREKQKKENAYCNSLIFGRILENPVVLISKSLFTQPHSFRALYLSIDARHYSHKWINTGAYSLGVAAFLALGVAFFLVAVLAFLGAAAFLGLVAFFVAVFLGAWNYNLRKIT